MPFVLLAYRIAWIPVKMFFTKLQTWVTVSASVEIHFNLVTHLLSRMGFILSIRSRGILAAISDKN